MRTDLFDFDLPEERIALRPASPRDTARMLVVQPDQPPVDSVVREFRNHRFDADIDGAPLAEADEDWFAAVVHGVVEDQRAIDEAIKARLASNWRLERLDATLRALLRSGAWELKHKPDVPREIVIDEYVELAKAFFDDAEAKFVNAALDGVARDARD